MLVDRRNEEEDEEEDNHCEDTSKVLLPYMPSSDNPHICVTVETAIAFVNRFDLTVNHYDKNVTQNSGKYDEMLYPYFFPKRVDFILLFKAYANI